MSEISQSESLSASQQIDARIAELGDWRDANARARPRTHPGGPARYRRGVKWRGVPVWFGGSQICTGETYKATVKLTFAKGARIDHPVGLFNISLDGTTRRAIDLREDDTLDADTFKALILAAQALNRAKTR